MKVYFFIIIFLLSAFSAWSEEPIEIMYHQRAPYSVVEPEGNVSGLAASPINRALVHANIPAVWIEVPAKRQLFYIRENKKPTCGVGWFKNPAREQFAKFTSPVYLDSAMIGLALKSSNLPESTSLPSLFANREIILLVQSGYSYGVHIDQWIERLNPVRNEVSVDNQKIFKMINYGRGDYVFMSTEEAYELIISNDLPMNRYQFIYFEEMEIGDKRYLMCSKKVDDRVIQEVNEWLNINVGIE